MYLNALLHVRVATATAAFSLASIAHAVTVSAASSAPTAIGAVVAGQTYTVGAAGTADLYVGFNGGLGLTFTANGKPTYAFPAPYAAFFPNGLDYDPSVGPSNVGVGGAGRLLGALLGTFSAAPASPAAYFVIGLGNTFTATANGTLYGIVNDTYYPDNGAGGFNVTLAAVPEPSTWLLLLAGTGIAAIIVRQRRVS